MDYKNKYIKYKTKYELLKNQLGGTIAHNKYLKNQFGGFNFFEDLTDCYDTPFGMYISTMEEVIYTSAISSLKNVMKSESTIDIKLRFLDSELKKKFQEFDSIFPSYPTHIYKLQHMLGERKKVYLFYFNENGISFKQCHILNTDDTEGVLDFSTQKIDSADFSTINNNNDELESIYNSKNSSDLDNFKRSDFYTNYINLINLICIREPGINKCIVFLQIGRLCEMYERYNQIKNSNEDAIIDVNELLTSSTKPLLETSVSVSVHSDLVVNPFDRYKDYMENYFGKPDNVTIKLDFLDHIKEVEYEGRALYSDKNNIRKINDMFNELRIDYEIQDTGSTEQVIPDAVISKEILNTSHVVIVSVGSSSTQAYKLNGEYVYHGLFDGSSELQNYDKLDAFLDKLSENIKKHSPDVKVIIFTNSIGYWFTNNTYITDYNDIEGNTIDKHKIALITCDKNRLYNIDNHAISITIHFINKVKELFNTSNIKCLVEARNLVTSNKEIINAKKARQLKNGWDKIYAQELYETLPNKSIKLYVCDFGGGGVSFTEYNPRSKSLGQKLKIGYIDKANFSKINKNDEELQMIYEGNFSSANFQKFFETYKEFILTISTQETQETQEINYRVEISQTGRLRGMSENYNKLNKNKLNKSRLERYIQLSKITELNIYEKSEYIRLNNTPYIQIQKGDIRPLLQQ